MTAVTITVKTIYIKVTLNKNNNSNNKCSNRSNNGYNIIITLTIVTQTTVIIKTARK